MIIDETNEVLICYLIKQHNCEITAGVAKKNKEDYLLCKKNSKNYYLNESAIKNYKNERNVKVIFTKNEIEKYFKNVPKHNLKKIHTKYCKRYIRCMRYLLWIR